MVGKNVPGRLSRNSIGYANRHMIAGSVMFCRMPDFDEVCAGMSPDGRFFLLWLDSRSRLPLQVRTSVEAAIDFEDTVAPALRLYQASVLDTIRTISVAGLDWALRNLKSRHQEATDTTYDEEMERLAPHQEVLRTALEAFADRRGAEEFPGS